MTTATRPRLAELPVDAITPFPGNAKRGDVPAILESLRTNGQYRAVVVREHAGRHTSLAGNHTVLAIAMHGRGDCGTTVTVDGAERPCGLCGNADWEPVARCEIIDCDETAALRINLADNRTADLGTTDDQALALLLAELDSDYTGTGWTDADLDDLYTALDQAAAVDQGDDGEEPPQRPTAAPAERPTAVLPTGPAPGEPAPPLPTGHGTLFLTYLLADREEVTRLVHAAREILPDADAADLMLRGLRTLVAVLDARHAHDGVVTAAALLKTAGIPS